MTATSERDALLKPSDSDSDSATEYIVIPATGPLDVSMSTRYGILSGIFTAVFLSALNTTLVPTMLPSISSEFQASHLASWLGTAYLLATSTFNPLYGRLCDVLGRRRATQTAICFTLLGQLLCAFSTSMPMLIFARFIAGFGGGGIFVISPIVTSDLYDLRSRALTQGFAQLFQGLGMGCGGPVGGLVTDWLGWRWAFLIQVPLSLLSLFLISYNLRYTTPGKGKSTVEMLKRIDWAGSAFLLITVGSCLVFLSSKYNEGLNWNDTRVTTPLILTVVTLVAFMANELFVAKEPVLEPSLFKRKVPVLTGISNFLVANCNFTILFYFPMFFQVVMLTSASIAGLHLAPNSVCLSFGALLTGWIIHRTGKYRMLNVTLGALPFLGTYLISHMKEDSSPLHQWASIIPLGLGNAIVMQTMLTALLADLPDEKVAVGTGFGTLFRGIGEVGGVAISSAIFQHSLDANLHANITGPNASETIRSVRRSFNFVRDLPPDVKVIVKTCYKDALHTVFVYASISTLLAYIVRLFVPERSLDRRTKSPTESENSNHAPTNYGSTATQPALTQNDETSYRGPK